MKKLLGCILLMSFMFSACTGKRVEHDSLLLIDRHNGYTQVTILNPWKSGQTLHTYLLVPRNQEIPSNLPEGTLIRTPLKKVLVYSDVYARPISEIGEIASICAVCDAEYFKTPKIVDGLKTGAVVNCGSSLSPLTERIISAEPEAIILSPMENSGYGVLENMGIPLIEMADYMEATPLSRARWIEFLGLLYGKEKEAGLIYEQVTKDYETLTRKVSDVDRRPTVVSEMMTGGVWYVPGGKSYKAALFKDAGADYPWADNASTGSLPLDFGQVLNKAQGADFWLVNVYGYSLTRAKMKELYPHNDQMKAFKEGNVYYVDSSKSTLFEDTPFHPERLLREYIKIFHPALLPDYQLKYYKRMEDGE